MKLISGSSSTPSILVTSYSAILNLRGRFAAEEAVSSMFESPAVMPPSNSSFSGNCWASLPLARTSSRTGEWRSILRISFTPPSFFTGEANCFFTGLAAGWNKLAGRAAAPSPPPPTFPPISSLCTPASNAAEATEDAAAVADDLDLLLAAAASKSAWPPEVSMPLSLSLPELLELASSDIPEEDELLLEELLSEGALPRSHLALSRPGVSRSDRTVTFSSTAAAAAVVGASPEDVRFLPRLRT